MLAQKSERAKQESEEERASLGAAEGASAAGQMQTEHWRVVAPSRAPLGEPVRNQVALR
jgi:hypothetical protein